MASGTIPQPLGVQDIAITYDKTGVTPQGVGLGCKCSGRTYILDLALEVTKDASTGWYYVCNIPQNAAPSVVITTMCRNFGTWRGEAKLETDGKVYIDHPSATAGTTKYIRMNFVWMK